MKILSIFLFFILTSNFIYTQSIQSTYGTEFWMSFHTRYEWAAGNDTDISLHIITKSEGAQVTVKLVDLNWEKTIFINPNLSQRIKVPFDLVKNPWSGQIKPYGIHIIASKPIQVTAFNRLEAMSDGTEILPIELLGTDYTLLSQGYLGGQATHPDVTIVATKDNTEIEVIPTAKLKDSIHIQPFTLNLNKGETFQFITRKDPSGTEIHSCEPIAVFIGNPMATVPGSLTDCHCSDRFWMQIPPIEYWNTNYCFTPITYPNNSLQSIFALKIIAQKDSTNVAIDGYGTITLNKGETEFITEMETAGCIHSNSPIIVGQMMYGGRCIYDSDEELNGDPSFLLLSPINNRLNSLRFKKPLVSPLIENEIFHYATFILKTEDQNEFEISGNIFDGNFNTFPYTDSLMWTTVLLGNGFYTASAPNGVLGTRYGVGNYDSYHHNLPYQLENTGIKFELPEEVCINKEILLEPSGFYIEHSNYFEWRIGEDIISNDSLSFYQFNSAGTYTITLIVETEFCQSKSISKEIKVIGITTPNFLLEGITETNPFDTFLYVIPTIETSEYNWVVENGRIIEQKRDSIWVKWDNLPSGQLSVVEETIEGCIGNTANLSINIQEFKPGENSCFDALLPYPNPSVSMVTVSFLADGGGDYTMTVINTSGQLLIEDSVIPINGNNQVDIDISRLPSGVYFVRFTNGDCEDFVKVVKMK